ncbi:carbamoyltransferase HypF [Methyloprofundus sp.]|uniref:carbamoyltransferase HypF n=1 Tax=Methyloprofundus sp. TaxID=2020875 RepID=UPI003D09B223
MCLKKHLSIQITGFVQGLGFRPFVYRLATQYQQNGWVANTSAGVSIALEGVPDQQQLFLSSLQKQLPPFAEIRELSIQQKQLKNYASFSIKPSSTNGQHSAFALPDISPCPDCLKDLINPASRFYRYPFTSCCYCGPRYSIMRQQPYDRIRTSMAEFTACPDCLKEYATPDDRRFHSQTIACPRCGPQLSLVDSRGNKVQQNQPVLAQAIELLKQGKILAIKGVGGFQLIADASNQPLIESLRLRKQRPAKPFALLLKDLSSVQALCHVSSIEKQALSSRASPIVLLKRLSHALIADAVAPNNDLLGIMLPASPLHYLLAHDFNKPLVATSGNLSDDPICISNQQAVNKLGEIADFFLMHNREIIHPLDDSIVRQINNKPTCLRRARGYVPIPINISRALPDMLAVGGQMKNTVAISLGKQLIVSQHIGNLDSASSQEHFQRTMTDLQTFYGSKASVILHDLHPDYHSSRFASQQALPKQAIQHHYAHILSCMAEYDLTAPVLGFAWDGTGLGTDNSSWGGECLLLTQQKQQRFAHFRQFPLAGGDKAAIEPRRSALGLLYEMENNTLFQRKELSFLAEFSTQELSLLQQILNKRINTPLTSSVGRLFDAVASLLNLCHINQFEGQAAMLLEQAANRVKTEYYYPFELSGESPIVIDWMPMVQAILFDLGSLDSNIIAAKFHNTLAEMTVHIAERAHQQQIVLSGGCFQNAYLTDKCVSKLETAGFSVYTQTS